MAATSHIHRAPQFDGAFFVSDELIPADSALAQDFLPGRCQASLLHGMNRGENFVGFTNEVQTIFPAASSINLQQQIRIGTLQLFQGHTCLGLVFENE